MSNAHADKILSNLNPEQHKAVKHQQGPLLIIAGAGSGKTRVLTRRTAYLIASGISQHNILAVTFTNKAAAEMRHRITSLVDGAPTTGTFHAICARILRKDIHHLGMKQDFNIYDIQDQQDLIKRCLKELNIDEKRFRPRALVDKISRLKDQLVEPQGWKTQTVWEDHVHEVYKKYTFHLQNNNALDFGDLILLTIKLFQDYPQTLRSYQDRYQYILVDEYQDTNYAQYMWVKLLAQKHKNICVVGDPDQSIYSWRGADITNILMFEKDYPTSTVIKLEKNYRSTQNILSAANRLIAHNTNRKSKNLWSQKGHGEQIKYYEAFDERDEAMHVAKHVHCLHKENVSLNKMVVFYRVHAQSRVLEDILRKEKIPYKIVGGISFYARKEVKDILAYLRVIHSMTDDVSLLRIINAPARGIGQATIDKLLKCRSEQQMSLLELLRSGTPFLSNFLSNTLLKRLDRFTRMILELRQRASDQSVADTISDVLDMSGYGAMLKQSDLAEDEDRLENIKELLSTAVEMDIEEPPLGLDTFLEHIALASHVDQWQDDGKALTLMTLHCAKGLEFPVVFMVGLEETLLPHANSIHKPDAIEEERRLCYVGVTRSQETLHLSSAVQRIYNGKFVQNFPSRFLEEMSFASFEHTNSKLALQDIVDDVIDVNGDPLSLDGIWRSTLS